ncbi:hypothetical protein CDSM653_00958 [Caldanaerobacter subterraneus subsp. pacificus DSM 12653]|uniref:Uncharacterized protein n=1 Tax=Caldanaerobacter subterraneus subsp. pacificus DSM 12653 TaxID=391606 RepID=A0A0F5PMV6_9THEO|nr:hypothetical protein CDSM653_00958 [Caldanaerobacter subterraneus subsp. pacificus DSM 12653]
MQKEVDILAGLAFIFGKKTLKKEGTALLFNT